MPSKGDAERRGSAQDDLSALEAVTSDLPALPLDELLQVLARRLADVSGAGVGALWLLDDEDELVLHALEQPAGFELTPGAGEARAFATRLAREGRPLAIPDLALAPIAADAATCQSGVRALLGAPLKVGGRTIGAVYVGLLEPRQCSAHELRRFAVLADQAAAAIEHTRLLEQSQRHAADLERANAELREIDRLKAEFLSMVSHELRTPLTAILGYTDLLLGRAHGSLNERQLRYEHAVHAGARRLLALINDLLDVSRLESGRFEISPEPLELGPTLHQAVEAALAEAQAKGTHLQLTTRPTRRPVLADRERLLQVLHHLLANALKFTPSGGEVVLAAEPRGEDEVCISVRDTGMGITAEHLHRIWDHFYQVDSTIRRVHGGSGLGLTIVKRLVELHGGRVWADSDGLGKGSSFSFTLPLAPVAAAEAAPAEFTPGDGRTVLVVEDEPDNRDVLRIIVETLVGLNVIEACDGAQALELAERRRPDAILLDLMLPGLDGFEVARRLKANARLARIPVVAVSALAQPDDRDRALMAGADAFLAKPFDAEDLAQLLRRLLMAVPG